MKKLILALTLIALPIQASAHSFHRESGYGTWAIATGIAAPLTGLSCLLIHFLKCRKHEKTQDAIDREVLHQLRSKTIQQLPSIKPIDLTPVEKTAAKRWRLARTVLANATLLLSTASLSCLVLQRLEQLSCHRCKSYTSEITTQDREISEQNKIKEIHRHYKAQLKSLRAQLAQRPAQESTVTQVD